MRKKEPTLEALFICTTPLQMFIAKNIIRSQKITNYGVITIYIAGKSKKYDYYHSRLAKNASYSHKYIPKHSNQGLFYLLNSLIYKYTILKKYKQHNIETVYVASIDNRYIQITLSKLSYKRINTFDDGFANLNYQGAYYASTQGTQFKRVIWWAIGAKFSVQDLRKLTTKHYTLFPNKKNISNNIYPINLSIKTNTEHKSNKETVSFFLGQPLKEINPKLDSDYIKSTLRKLNITHYFPHPREKSIKFKGIKIIHSDKIFEEYVNDFYNNHSLKKINIYSFCSTALLNLTAVPFIRTYYISSKYIPKEIYKVLENFDHPNLKKIVLDE